MEEQLWPKNPSGQAVRIKHNIDIFIVILSLIIQKVKCLLRTEPVSGKKCFQFITERMFIKSSSFLRIKFLYCFKSKCAQHVKTDKFLFQRTKHSSYDGWLSSCPSQYSF